MSLSESKCLMFWRLRIIQGRKWLPKSGGASSNTSSNAAWCRRRRRLLFCQKVGGGNWPPCLPPFTYAPAVYIVDQWFFMNLGWYSWGNKIMSFYAQVFPVLWIDETILILKEFFWSLVASALRLSAGFLIGRQNFLWRHCAFYFF